MLNEFLPQKMGITTTFVPLDDLAAVRAAIQPNTKVLLFCFIFVVSNTPADPFCHSTQVLLRTCPGRGRLQADDL